MNADERLKNAVAELDEKEALRLASEMMASGAEPIHIIEVCRAGLDAVGDLYARKEYFLSALIMSGEIFKGVMEILNMAGCFEPKGGSETPKVVLGVPLGDVHDIGKDIISMLLRCHGFEVVDLGVSVPPAVFAEAVRVHRPSVVSMSVLLTVAFEPVQETVRALEHAGLRDSVKVMLGGGASCEKLRRFAGADRWSHDALDAVRFAREFSGKGK
jgi:5-methyltetrahydrofolate--homocysteine methyltransferase